MPSHLTRIHNLLPYGKSFRFVDSFTRLDEHSAEGSYTFPQTSWYYEGHFPDRPVTPGVILTECMAQIGLVGLGMFLMKVHEEAQDLAFAFTSSEVEFEKMVLPNETVTVVSEKVYFRFKKLKCKVSMYNTKGERVCQGTLAGMIVKPTDHEEK